MMKQLTVEKSININARKEEVWDALTNPEKIKIYLFGTETSTDWKVGSSISFKGEYQGTTYHDKGNVLQNSPFQCLKYNYWTTMSGLEDKPDNYSIITYTLVNKSEDEVVFTWRQEGFSSEEGYNHMEKFLPDMLKVIKDIAEKK
ncbi:SRPBCC domain-containing protein [Lishizhenia sp.]|uniref:SRPBCC domain-containing protein n=1 Tax=Lishizhenia sp. TaxID=2497594 RepID=UPI00299CF5AF|nr:SRPBCC domain-containing protein [Lishizhenia sp.]MDX1446979.1 SRPBCC domain-containing protein [Lishizhenia sp.]